MERKIYEKLPFEIVEPENDIPNNYLSVDNGLVFVGPKRYAERSYYKKHGLDIYNFEARPDDIYLVGCQRTGTTLHSEMVWLIQNDLDFESAAKDILDHRFPHIDFSVIGVFEFLEIALKANKDRDKFSEIHRKYQELDLKGLSEQKGRRFIRSHLPLSLMPPHIFEVGAKVIYCARNPKDMLVSLYNMYSNIGISLPDRSFQNYIDVFKNDSAFTWPYIEHVKEGWDRRNDENFLFLFYEDTIRDKRRTIQKVADFLGKNLSEDQVDRLEDHLKIENFRNNKSVNWDSFVQMGLFKDSNKFIRKGESGGWKELFDEEAGKEFDQIVEEKLKGTDLRFPSGST
ncbi:estrogen sulfotransferase-like [Anoplophora glabripennis]|uniref:estrogen sulfotransferase-like n=1 Tax=Anoplophora glabripennis TaxID=217634 RepID=UPI000C791954|nr:estrogen sulfotransferase-like [Anoplophora glabripennis]XP_023313153.1 estrogen sulfotransferase-like [Anoplophora glabripennis]